MTNAMNEFGFLGKDNLMGLGKLATVWKFKYRWLVPVEKFVFCNTRSARR
ncbi:conserved hypothetical protein [Imperialibacter sp. EC-SDR9]|nr:conserved hypothetical protein [Imperialibacter sp. 75]CAD5266329.1 conserved hypothetical protein [Imperialibacter sp. 89]VVT23844.1 conserved hypothetical protein [Imperialibacter sp. EC-SDR9]